MEQMSISITMTVAQWNVVMNALGQRPFGEVADIIGNIKAQADQQLAPKVNDAPEAPAEAI
jgi:hypothetical protein